MSEWEDVKCRSGKSLNVGAGSRMITMFMVALGQSIAVNLIG